MSHTSTVKNIQINNIIALKAALFELKKQGIHCNLIENSIPRGYYSNQSGLGIAPYVINIEGCSYDLGLYKNNEFYEVRGDFYGNKIGKILGVEIVKDIDMYTASIGKLMQAYSIAAIELSAMEKGYNITKSTNSNGEVLIEIMEG